MTPPEMEGVLPVDKPVGPTSHDMVAATRRALGQRRVGHTGTLDPFASGLLLLLLGRATRLAEYLADLPKRYTATAHLGVATDTEDRTGQVSAASDAWRDLAADRVRAAFESMTGARIQRPPAFSAKKVAGERAYAAARRGEEPALQPVPIRIDSLRVTRVELPFVTFEVTCSTGTYIRSIARDAGEELGVFGHLAELRRTGIGPWDAQSALPLDRLDPTTARLALVTPWEALGHRPRVEVSVDDVADLERGVSIPAPAPTPSGQIVATGLDGRLVAVTEARDGRLYPRKVFHG